MSKAIPCFNRRQEEERLLSQSAIDNLGTETLLETVEKLLGTKGKEATR